LEKEAEAEATNKQTYIIYVENCRGGISIKEKEVTQYTS
jgi:hypothetical protein